MNEGLKDCKGRDDGLRLNFFVGKEWDSKDICERNIYTPPKFNI